MPEKKPRTAPKKTRPKVDEILAKAVDMAHVAAEDIAGKGRVGDHLGCVMEDTRLLTHWFASTDEGYVGWRWAVTVARAPRSKDVTVCEVDRVPGEGALLSPEWVPLDKRMKVADSDGDDGADEGTDI